jgi:hypothetical protein
LPPSLLDKPGTGDDDCNAGKHPDVVVSGERTYLYYFVHPGVPDDTRSAIQVAELRYVDGWLQVDRDAAVFVDLKPESSGAAAAGGSVATLRH